jgi:hypothetical protein
MITPIASLIPDAPSRVHAGRNQGQVPSSAVHDFLPGGARLLQFCHPIDQRQVAVRGIEACRRRVLAGHPPHRDKGRFFQASRVDAVIRFIPRT